MYFDRPDITPTPRCQLHSLGISNDSSQLNLITTTVHAMCIVV